MNRTRKTLIYAALFSSIISCSVVLTSICNSIQSTSGVINVAKFSEDYHGATSSEKLAWAKRTLDLSIDAPSGALWQTYMTRYYDLPYNSTLAQIQRKEDELGGFVNATWVPEWFPTRACFDRLEDNFSYEYTGRLAVRYVYGVSPFVSDDEMKKQIEGMREDFRKSQDASDTALTLDEWEESLIRKAFFLTPDTSKTDVILTYTMYQHPIIWAINGFASLKTCEQINKTRDHQLAIRVLHAPADTSLEQLNKRMDLLKEAIQLDRPDIPHYVTFS